MALFFVLLRTEQKPLDPRLLLAGGVDVLKVTNPKRLAMMHLMHQFDVQKRQPSPTAEREVLSRTRHIKEAEESPCFLHYLQLS